MSPVPAVMFLGPPASGKTTQARAAAAIFGWAQIDTGELLRRARDKTGPLGSWVRRAYASGGLGPPPLVAQLVLAEVQRLLPTARGLVFHGSPRTLREADELLATLQTTARQGLNVVVALEITRAESERRIAARWSCGSCGAAGSRAAPADTCPRCGAALARRSDDTPDAVARRWGEYTFRTAPVIPYLAHRLRVIRVPGERPVAEVTVDVQRILREIFPAFLSAA